MFYGCSMLIFLSDISDWNTEKVINMSNCLMNMLHLNIYPIDPNGILII